MLNAKYLVFDTLNTKKPFSSGVLNAKIFSMSEQYNLKYGRIRTRMVKVLLVFYSLLSLLSHHFIPFFLSSLILPQTFQSTLLFFFHSFFFSLLLLLSLPFSLATPLLNLMPISIAMVFIFHFLFIFIFCNDLMGGFSSGWVQMVMGKSMVVGCDGQIQWWMGQPVGGLQWYERFGGDGF